MRIALKREGFVTISFSRPPGRLLVEARDPNPSSVPSRIQLKGISEG